MTLLPAEAALARHDSPKAIAWWNLATFGAGYARIGQWQKALAALLLALMVGPITLGIGAVLLAAFTAVDGYREAMAEPRGQWTFLGKR
jgi:integral membrane sensor domain MASE1